ncbi:MAG: cell division protein ZapA [Bacteroides sp.]|nr:cell division protein ZapA [Bacteroides sp.]
MDDMMKINLLIDCQRYPLNIRREDELLYRDAAKLIDKTLNKYRSWRPELSSNQHWAMAALELAYAFISNKDRNDTQPYLKKLEELTEELDNYISKK